MNKAVIIGVIVAVVIGVIIVSGFSENTEMIEEVDDSVEETPTPAGRDLSVELVESIGLKTP